MNDLHASLHGVVVFLRVVEFKNFSAAARQLGVTTSAVSTTITRLEESLGVRLLNRTTRRMSLTPEGTAFHARCKEVVEALMEAEQTISKARKVPAGTLRVGVPAVLGRTWIIPHLPEFVSRYPDVKLETIFTNYDGPSIVDGQVDVAVQIGELQSSRLTARRLASRRRVLCASASYVALHGVPRTPQELTSHLLIGYRSPRDGRIRDWRFRFGATIRKVPLNFYMVFNSAEALIAAAKAGLGVIETAEYYVNTELQSGDLQEVLRPYSFEDSMIYAVFSKEQSGAKARVFIDFLVALFNRPPWNKQSDRIHLQVNK